MKTYENNSDTSLGRVVAPDTTEKPWLRDTIVVGEVVGTFGRNFVIVKPFGWQTTRTYYRDDLKAVHDD